jgi:hypothetical protein
MRIKLFFPVFLFITACSANQTQRWSVILTSGDTIQDCRLVRLSPDTLFGKQSAANVSVAVESICSLEPSNNPEVFTRIIGVGLLGSWIGMIAGAAENNFKSMKNYTRSEHDRFSTAMLIGVGSGVLIGGMLGWYNPPHPLLLADMSAAQKVTAILPHIERSGTYRSHRGGGGYHPRPRRHR